MIFTSLFQRLFLLSGAFFVSCQQGTPELAEYPDISYQFMEQIDSSAVNLEPVTSSFLVEDILRRSGSSVLENSMESTSPRTNTQNNFEVKDLVGYDTVDVGSGASQEFSGLSCMVAEAERKGTRAYSKCKFHYTICTS